MKKFRFLWLMGLIALISFSASAIPAKHGTRTYTQADGTSISLELVGDEYFHSLLTSDGLPVTKCDDGNFYYHTANGVSDVIAHDINLRSANEAAFINANAADLSVSALSAALKANNKMRQAPKRGIRRSSQVPSSGSPKVPIILVQYSDYSFKDSDPVATFKEFFNSGSVSAFQYFKDQSNGKYTPEFDIYGPVTLTNKRSYYGGNDSSGYDKYVGTMVGQACNSINSSLDFSQYDNDGDGECDVVIVIYAGDGEASSYDSDAANAIWPCQWSLSSSDYGKSLTLDKTKVDKFAVFNELYGADLTKIDGIGTFCHEFSHCLDLPDFYDTNYAAHFGMGPWSLMDYGSYNNNGYTPIGYSSYEKEFMGWITPDEGQENTKYTLSVFNQKSESTDKAVKLTNSKDSNEYYLFENRAQQGWDAYIPAEGMMITHVTYLASAWTSNIVNNNTLQRMTIIPADNNLKLKSYTSGGTTYYTFDSSNTSGDLWPSSSATELTNTSTPAATVNTGTYMNKPVTEITKNSDGTISFWVMKSDDAEEPEVTQTAVAAPSNLAASATSSTSADLSWKAGDSNKVTYTVEVSEHSDAAYSLVSSTTFADGYSSWTSSTVTKSNGEVYVGSSNNIGSLISPAFTTDDSGIVTVIFSSKYYGSDNSSIIVSLLDASGNSLSSETISLSSEYATYVQKFSASANTSVKVKFENTAKKKRVYMKSADIYTGDASSVASGAAKGAQARVAAGAKTYTGISATKLSVSNLDEGGSYDFRVKAVPSDTENYLESEWSDKVQFSLPAAEVVPVVVAAPSNLAAEVQSSSAAKLSWKAGDSNDVSYSVEISKKSGSNASVVKSLSGIKVTYVEVADLDEDSSYSFRVKAVPNDSEAYSESEWSDACEFTLPAAEIIPVVVAAPSNLAAEVQSSSAAKLSWKAGDSNDVTYSVQISKKSDNSSDNNEGEGDNGNDNEGGDNGDNNEASYSLISSTEFSKSSYGDWTASGSVNTASGETDIYLGASKNTGSITSAAFDADANGVVTVIFSAKYYGDDKSSAQVSVLDASSEDEAAISSEAIELSSEYATYVKVFSGLSAGASVKIKFENTGNKKRYYLKSAALYQGDASAAAKSAARAEAEAKVISGIKDTYVEVSDLDANATYEFRVKAVPNNSEAYSESEWSDACEFTLPAAEVIPEVVVVAVPSNLAAEVQSSSTAKLSWKAGDSNDVTYSVQISKISDNSSDNNEGEGDNGNDNEGEGDNNEGSDNGDNNEASYSLISSTDFYSGTTGWDKSGYSAKSANEEALQMGSTNNTCSFTSSSAFSADDSGIVSAIIEAKYYGTDESSLKVSILDASNSDAELDSKTIELSDSYAKYAIVFNVSANASVKIKFETLANKKRAYVKTVDVYNGDASAAAKSVARAEAEAKVISGIKDTYVEVSDLDANATYEFRVKAVPNNSEAYSESEWSDACEFTLPAAEVIPEVVVVAVPSNLAAEVQSSTAAKLSWEAGDSNDVSYSVQISKISDNNSDNNEDEGEGDNGNDNEGEGDSNEGGDNGDNNEASYSLISSTEFSKSSYGDWTASGSVNTASGETDIYLGASKNTGSITSAAFDADANGVVTVIFSAKYYGDDKSSAQVSVLDASSEDEAAISSEAIELSSEYATYVKVFSGLSAGASVKIKFENTGNKKRYYLKSAALYQGDASAAAKSVARAEAEAKVISGIKDTYVEVSDLDANATYEFRVKAVPNNSEAYSESEWSDACEFTLYEIEEIEPVAVSAPYNLSYENKTSDSAELSWSASDNSDVTYTVELTKVEENNESSYSLISSTEFSKSSYGDWTASGSVNTASGETDIYIGASKNTGSITSAAFDADANGVITVIFSAKYYGSDKSSAKVSVLDASDSDSTLKYETIELSSEYETYVKVFNNLSAGASVKIKFENTANNKRYYLKSAALYQGDASEAINSAASRAEAVGESRVISDIEGCSVIVSDLTEKASYTFRVKAVPNDLVNYKESEWSEVCKFAQSATNGVESIAIDSEDAEYYNLQGIRINGRPAAPGVYIRRQGSDATKVLIK